ncbi:hypothetical protein [Streptomyces chartreusis]
MTTTTTPRGKVLSQATDLIAHAEEHGWTVIEQWTPPGYQGAPILRVVIGRRTAEGEFLFRLSWCTNGTRPDRWMVRTPKNPKWHKAPPLTALRIMILTHSATRPPVPRSERS